jgi:hypothetical protein
VFFEESATARVPVPILKYALTTGSQNLQKMNPQPIRISFLQIVSLFAFVFSVADPAVFIDISIQSAVMADDRASVQQITHGPLHHFFGYIGHVQTIPWNASERWIVCLRTPFQDRMPTASEAADVVLLDCHNQYRESVVDRTYAWNFQQGTMFYWNPSAPETQLFFNDRDPVSGDLMTVLLEISTPAGDSGQVAGKRLQVYCSSEGSIANSGVCPVGNHFAAINYGRLARLRPVTGYPDAVDPTSNQKHPDRDGVFVVNSVTGEHRLVVSYKKLADVIRTVRSDIDRIDLFINHTLWSPGGKRLFFFCRGEFEHKTIRVDIPFTVRPDGSELTMLKEHFGGHPEWLNDEQMIGRQGTRQAVYDVVQQRFVSTIGAPETFVNPGGDIALSPDRKWLVNGYSAGPNNLYLFCHMANGRTVFGGPLPRGPWRAGELRIDPSPAWNRSGTAVLTTALAPDEQATRQLFLIKRADSGQWR